MDKLFNLVGRKVEAWKGWPGKVDHSRQTLPKARTGKSVELHKEAIGGGGVSAMNELHGVGGIISTCKRPSFTLIYSIKRAQFVRLCYCFRRR